MKVSKLLVAAAWAVVMCAVLFAQTLTRMQRPGGIDLTSYLLSADVLRHGGSPYLLPTPFPYLYPATLAFLLIPLTFVPATIALLVWFPLNAAAAIWSIRALVRDEDRPATSVAAFLAVFFTVFFSVLQSNLRNGQVNFLVLALCVAAVLKPAAKAEESDEGPGAAPAAMPSRGDAKPRRGISEETRRGWGPAASGKKLAGGSWWSLATALKLVPLVLFPYFLLRRSWLWLAVSVASIAAWCLLPAVIVGPRIVDIYRQFWSVLSATSLASHAQPFDFSLAGTLAWITGAPLTTALKASAAAVVIGWIMPVDARRLRALDAAAQERPTGANASAHDGTRATAAEAQTPHDATPTTAALQQTPPNETPATAALEQTPPNETPATAALEQAPLNETALRASDQCAFALYLLSIPLLSPQSEVHHLAFMLPAAATVAAALWWDWPRATTWLRVSAFAAAGLYLTATAVDSLAGPLFCASLIAFGVAVMQTLPPARPKADPKP